LLGYGGVEWRPPAPDLVSRVLLVGDETAAPAICSILEGALHDGTALHDGDRVGYRGHAVIEVPTAADVLPLDVPAGIEVRWLVRGETPRGVLALDAVREICAADPHPRAGDCGEELPEVDVDAELLWENGAAAPAGTRNGPFAWVAGEAAMVRDIRRHLVGEACLERSRVVFMGYWREGRSALG
jgi:NADPH-dependent ferric siderophore reductase